MHLSSLGHRSWTMDTSDAAMPDDVAGGGHESNPDAVALETRNSLLYLASHSATMSTLSAACLFGWGLGLAGFIGFESLAIWSVSNNPQLSANLLGSFNCQFNFFVRD